MWKIGLNPLVIPNGIPGRLLDNVDEKEARKFRRALDNKLVFSKIARWDPDKRWNTAIEAIAKLKSKGKPVVLRARGGVEPHGAEVIDNAHGAGLTVKEVICKGATLEERLQAIEDASQADFPNLTFFLLEEHEREKQNIREAGKRTARQYTWEQVTANLISKLHYLASKQEVRWHE